MNRLLRLLSVTSLAVLSLAPAHADDLYPSKPVRIISPYAAGGTNDFLARMSSLILTNAYDKTAVVENRLGGGGIIGSTVVARAKPDGYTLLLGSISTHSIGPIVYSKMPYDVNKDFTPISIVAEVPMLLVVHPSVPATNLAELLALVRSQPGKLNYASAGAGTIPHMTAELFKTMAKVDITHVPYNGDAPAMNDVVGGQVQMTFANMPSAINFVRSGKMRAIAVASKTRSSALPDVPTIAEAGVPGFDVTAWYALFGPGNMPAALVSNINAVIAKGVRDPDMAAKIRAQGAEPVGNTSADFAAFMAKDQAKWKATAAASGVKLD
ncbi:tripartite tricarboxylate transporter substrate binding protein [Variovorax sp. LjRoot84]|uniref:Bug family tripartite tricarboxylate transporter substrate binding protein n=1 Tax=unclassified Variovorax TaxID=663243 RepID=UPI003ECE06ED